MFDVAVVGAGPSGTMAARICAKNQLKTILVEKKPLPREKTCGGWLTSNVLRMIHKNFGKIPKDLVENKLEEIVLMPECKLHQQINGASVHRISFDYWLAQKAEEAGVVIRNATLESLHQKRDRVVMKSRINDIKQEIQAKYVVGADGAGSTVRSSSCPDVKRQFAEACQTYVEGQLTKNTVYVYFPPKINQVTYFWIIPKKKSFVAGVGGLPPINLRKLMQNFLSMIGEKFKFRKILKREAHPIPVFSPASLALGEKRVLLVGDAASLVNPFNGEGISSSLVSGKSAGEAIIENFNDPPLVFEKYKKKMKTLLTRLKRMHALFTYYQSLDYRERQSILESYFETAAKDIF